MITPFCYIYGPVYSWRLGNSLGVDPLSGQQKICNMNCAYCQLGNTVQLSSQRQEHVSVPELLAEIKRIPPFFVDYITFSGRGEPTLARNLGGMIRAVKSIRREKVAVITNSSLLHLKDVQDDLMEADFVLAKLDAINQGMLDCIDGVCGIDYELLLRGLGKFRERFKGKFALQMMLVKDNIEYLKELSTLAYLLNPHEVQLNTPVRPSGDAPLGRETLEKAKQSFKGMRVITCYDVPVKNNTPFDEKATVARHGNYRKSCYTY
ncbi:MAG: radical SAM protein [Candidatus Omnitrophica bacterium]|nr:radical SAM protein [Candidatus Omnitrophota bacterium]